MKIMVPFKRNIFLYNFKKVRINFESAFIFVIYFISVGLSKKWKLYEQS